MQQVQTIGIDLAKNVFQVHGVDKDHEVRLVKQLRRNQVIAFFAKLEPCLIGMEACAPVCWRQLKLVRWFIPAM